MATVFENIPLNGIRRADLRQLEVYINDIEDSGCYWGNKAEFDGRHQRLKKLIEDAVRYAYSEGVKMPKQQLDADYKAIGCKAFTVGAAIRVNNKAQ